ITRRLMDRAAAEAGAQERARLALRTLSPREHEVVLAIARGHTNAEIATELYMSVATVKAHITHILTKLGLGNRTQIALLAHDANLA
ncbi:MAG TPA: LuxR C-terminal-related transcriptional regulator, partial [Streptosporangiaceae bacterium]